ncbi:MAG: hypothetical protein HY564_02730 [Candidatus Jacksonbacteria bacterium]|nr:hypothetical protein [Candidatus Jacksonbacteria bacterium]
MNHEQQIILLFNRACKILKLAGFTFRPMIGRISAVSDIKRSYRLGHTNLKTRTVTVDIYTARLRKPKKMSAILAVIAHELAHHQKKPYRQRYRGRWINRIHYPSFYRQVKKNMEKFKKDAMLGRYFIF